MLLLSKLYWDWGEKKREENEGSEREGGEREYTGRGVGETGAWSLKGRSDYTEGVAGNVCVMLHDCG